MLGIAVALFAAQPVHAQTTWGTGGNGGTGTWNTSNLNWFNGTSDIAWPTSGTATFAGTAGTVTISGSVDPKISVIIVLATPRTPMPAVTLKQSTIHSR